MGNNILETVKTLPSSLTTVLGVKTVNANPFINSDFEQDNVNVRHGDYFINTVGYLLNSYGLNKNVEWLRVNKEKIYTMLGPVEHYDMFELTATTVDAIFFHILSGSIVDGEIKSNLTTVAPFLKTGEGESLEVIISAAINNQRLSETLFVDTLCPEFRSKPSGMVSRTEKFLHNYHEMLTISVKALRGELFRVSDKHLILFENRLNEYCSNNIFFQLTPGFKSRMNMLNYNETSTMVSSLFYSSTPVSEWGAVFKTEPKKQLMFQF